MKFANIARSVMSIAMAFDGAREASSAVRNHRKPSPASLRKMGMDEKAFDDVNV